MAVTAAQRDVVGDNSRAGQQNCATRVFVDMDGVVVDFDRFRDERGLTGDQVKSMPGAYLDMPEMPGAIDAVRSLIGMGYEVWLATKPPTGIPYAYSDKVAWVLRHLPELKRRIIITHDKGLLGCANDVLCDDRPHKANCEQFPGTLLRFVDGFHWPQALEFFRAQRAARGTPSGQPALQRIQDRLIALQGQAIGEADALYNLAVAAGAAPEEAQGAAHRLTKFIHTLASSGILACVQRTAALVAAQRPAGNSGQAGQWVSCSPALIASGVDCAKTPRRPSHLNHEHFIAHGVAPEASCAQQDRPRTGSAQA